jgi:hypothetical protein
MCSEKTPTEEIQAWQKDELLDGPRTSFHATPRHSNCAEQQPDDSNYQLYDLQEAMPWALSHLSRWQVQDYAELLIQEAALS